MQVFLRHRQLLDAGIFELAHVPRSDAPAFLDDDLLADADFEARSLAAQALRDEPQRDFALRQVERVLLEERIEHLLLGETERAQDDRDRELAAPVDAGEHAILRVKLEIEPRAAVRNDARREQELARRVGLALVVVEEHARAAVQLGHDHALGAIDDERAVIGHERQLTEVDLLLADVLDGLLRARRILVEHHQSHLHAQRGGVGETTQLALLHIEHGIAEAIAHVFERRIARVAGDRENAVKRRVQTHLGALLLRHFGLQEALVGLQLDRKQIRHVQNALALAEVLANAFLLGKGIGHCD